MKRSLYIIIFLMICSIFAWFVFFENEQSAPHKTIQQPSIKQETEDKSITVPEDTATPHPMSVEALENGIYPGSTFVIHEQLQNGTNYEQYIVSYLSEGLTIYGLLTIPTSTMPENGYPAIIFIHGYIPPHQYSTTGNYPTYQARLARSNMITFKPDLRGHGNSEGEPVSAHFSEKYVIDTLNAIASMKQDDRVDNARIGYWGHSNGGEIGLRVAVLSQDIKAFDLWAGVVGSYEDMFETYNSMIPFLQDIDTQPLITEHGLPSTNPDFWEQLDPFFHLDRITAPIQLQHGDRDTSVPHELSQSLHMALEKQDKESTLYTYPGADHNIAQNVSQAFARSITFFEEHL